MKALSNRTTATTVEGSKEYRVRSTGFFPLLLTPYSLLLTSIILLVTFGLKLQTLLWGEWGYDQGFYFVVARLIDQGFTPYAEIHMSEQPLMVWSAYLPYYFLRSIWGMQFFMVCYALLGIAALVSLGRILVDPLTGLLAGLMLALSFPYFGPSHTVNPETTSLSLALMALASALQYRQSTRRRWLFLSLLAMAGSFLLKLFVIIMVPLIGLILVFYGPGKNQLSKPPSKEVWRRIALDCFLWAGGVTVIVGAGWLLSGLPALWEQSILFYLNRNAAHNRDLAFNLAMLGQLFSGQLLWSLLVAAGLGIAIAHFKRFGWIVLGWALLSLVYLLILTPLRSKHLVLLSPVLALLVGLALRHLIQGWQIRRPTTTFINWGLKLGLMLFGVLFLLEILSPFKQLSEPLKPLVKETRLPIVAVLEKFTTADDCIITDDPYIAFVSDRMPPPWLSNMSYARFESGSLDTQALIEIAQGHNCQALVPTYDRIKNGDRAFYDWAKGEYLRTWVVEGEEIMLGKPLHQAAPAMPLATNFNGQVKLLGADWKPEQAAPAKQVHVSLYWQTLKPFDRAYKIFVHLRNSAGEMVASADHEAFDGLIPTQFWRVDTIFKDTNRLTIPENVPPGQYTLYVGFYDPATLERLPIIDDQSGEHAAIIPVFSNE